jgi:hypothetical protein
MAAVDVAGFEVVVDIGVTFADVLGFVRVVIFAVLVAAGCFFATCALAIPAIKRNAEMQTMYFFIINFF